MSRNSKNARNVARRKSITALHLKGEKGPSKTTPKHEKRMGYRTNPASMKALDEFMKSQNGETDPREKTSGKKILREAGGASS